MAKYVPKNKLEQLFKNTLLSALYSDCITFEHNKTEDYDVYTFILQELGEFKDLTRYTLVFSNDLIAAIKTEKRINDNWKIYGNYVNKSRYYKINK